MYPSIVDMNENESSKCLRMLELDAYANMLAALRAQGPPTSDKLKLLKDIGTALRIPQERCKAEIRKVILDERLNTIAYFTCGQLETADEWIKEADEVAESASLSNEQLPVPALPDRKRAAPVSQVQQNVPESIKSQQFRIPDAFKNEESKKRKLSFGVENSTLAQHLIGPSKISRIQQIYRQKVKAKAKEQLQSKIKPDQQEHHEFRHLHQQTRVFQQPHFQQRVQKLPLSVQPSTSTSPKINILQNISLQPPNRGEETIEQIKNEVNSFMVQKATEQNRTSPQPGCSNENQAPKQQKQTVVNIKPNSNITYKHVASPGPSSELQKSLKVCATRKPVTKTVPGQKLIIVSNAQSITTSSILQRTLTIPFVKNISVKNFDKFKIVSTSTNTSNLQLTSLANTNTSTLSSSSAKHKVVTVRTNPTTKKVIPLAQLHALNAKGSIKMLPVGGKIITKATTTPATPPLCLVNSVSVPTKNIPTSVVTISSRSNELAIVSEAKLVPQPKNQEVASAEGLSDPEASVVSNESTESTNFSTDLLTSNNNTKSSVLADILKASGVITSDNESYVDIENHITQFAIPHGVPEKTTPDETQESQEFEVVENSEITDCHEEEITQSNNDSTFVLMDKDQETDRLLKDLEGEDSSDVVIGNLDPGTGEYTIETSLVKDETETESTILNDDTYMMEVQKQTTNIPDINAVN
ncbi:hypothetical protein ILUMI_10786 [Ignelater luminosus]|uniref:ENT domain-containing protein n=1 Tax=Ignelater luminosus TaxID=2038154 RepID=A0A8K0D1G5_IGNLU|nr:hypothetical protein ILUMI_10786 [Ignelater luminosus]